jgi:hypothetical protein
VEWASDQRRRCPTLVVVLTVSLLIIYSTVFTQDDGTQEFHKFVLQEGMIELPSATALLIFTTAGLVYPTGCKACESNSS